MHEDIPLLANVHDSTNDNYTGTEESDLEVVIIHEEVQNYDCKSSILIPDFHSSLQPLCHQK